MQIGEQLHKCVYTIGHSSHTSDEFVNLLQRRGVRAVVDVRSAPYSKYTPQFNKAELEWTLTQAGIQYRYSGQHLGGLPADKALYTPSGSPDYEKIAALPEFQSELAELVRVAGDDDTAIMCSEGDPMVCHRERLLARVLRSWGVEVIHITPDGELQRQEQGTLF